MASVRHMICATFAVLSLSACASSGPSETVAEVGSRSITKDSLDHWLLVIDGGPRASATDIQKRMRRSRQALEFLISSIWLVEEAHAQGVPPSQQEVQASLDAKRDTLAPGGNTEFLSYLHTSGQTIGDVRLEVQVELAKRKLKQVISERSGEISSARIASYYARHRKLFLLPERRKAAVASRASRLAIERLRQRVLAGQSLVSPAERKVGEGEVTVSNGDVAHRGPLEKAIYAARRGVLVGPVNDGVDYDLIIVKRIFRARQQTLAEVRKRIAGKLAAEQLHRTQATLTRQWMSQWTAKTDCRPAYVVEKCRQYHGNVSPENPFTTK